MTKLFNKLCSTFFNCALCGTLLGCRGSCIGVFFPFVLLYVSIKDFKCMKWVKIRINERMGKEKHIDNKVDCGRRHSSVQGDKSNVSRRHSRDFGSRRDRKTEKTPGKPLDSLSYGPCASTTNV